MKLNFKLKQYLNFEKILPYTLVFILFWMCLRINIIQQAVWAESQDEPHISLEVKNQRLGDVLKKITLDTESAAGIGKMTSTIEIILNKN